MDDVKEHDLVIIDSIKVGTVVFIYKDKTYEIEYKKDSSESYFETVSKEQITMILK